jgi:hypothetical protein
MPTDRVVCMGALIPDEGVTVVGGLEGGERGAPATLVDGPDVSSAVPTVFAACTEKV